MLQLIIEQGQSLGQTWPLSAGLTSVGRSADNDIILSGGQISRVHFVIEMVGPDQYVLTDKSTNGTLVNGRRAQTRTPLTFGDRIQVGDVVLRCEVGAVGTEAWPPSPAATDAPWSAPMPEPAAWPMPMSAPAASSMPAPRRRSASNAIPVAIGIIAAILILTVVITAPVFLSGRSFATPAPSVTPTTAAASVAVTATVEITATATLTATAIVTPNLAPAPVTATGRVQAGQGLNVRAAPETTAQRLYTLGQRAAVTAVGRNDAGDWYLIQCQSGQPADQKCWVFAGLVEWDQPGDQLPIVQP